MLCFSFNNDYDLFFNCHHLFIILIVYFRLLLSVGNSYDTRDSLFSIVKSDADVLNITYLILSLLINFFFLRNLQKSRRQRGVLNGNFNASVKNID